jgi:hypothetical protein
LRVQTPSDVPIMLKFITFALLAALSGPLHAYVGPGAGISVLGSLLGILATIVIAIGAILFWPIRKMMRKKKAKAAEEPVENHPTDP